MTEGALDMGVARDFPQSDKLERVGVGAIKIREEMRAGRLHRLWGRENISFHDDPQKGEVTRVSLQRGKVHGVNDRFLRRTTGAGFVLPRVNKDHAVISYDLRFPRDFPFVKGGKLPGIYGGDAPTGGDIVDGRSGFTTRFMWREGGKGEVYGYIPKQREELEGVNEIKGFGTAIGRGAWVFEADGEWHNLRQELVLNQPGIAEGTIKVTYDGNLVFENRDLLLRNSSSLKVDGLVFSVFHGGNNLSWAPEYDTSIDFANFRIDAA